MATQLSFLGRAERDRILEAFANNHRTYLESLRGLARAYALEHGCVTIDDVRRECEKRDFPMPGEIGADERVFGALFRSPEFRSVGQRQTTREAWAARIGKTRSLVTVYRVA